MRERSNPNVQPSLIVMAAHASLKRLRAVRKLRKKLMQFPKNYFLLDNFFSQCEPSKYHNMFLRADEFLIVDQKAAAMDH
jgi:hypothetical protein